ncbi:adenosylmethionine--8-amino-7-oxononanoate transaminase [Pseudodesulfovibrio sp. JC047]|uniref:adenosylmethionine--8-amino-7-oxononanoate transaminase n=1 Tax=Pseudodesulfovibrio sp. JC047 TaxID=2683199 RepID=UPI0013D59851|nr:adenosylmethionine--8-amino-7-oxononanoate transaminase [Pseudodesulfovibrio sp. JC047]NDV19278.1 adenosylmethionine--8-amino-7-oxononanoate transaminase [Pseudodesulfovibrio sp. JC047]
MNGYFITGTDTDVGKTCVTAALLRNLLDAGHHALALKPIQSGCRETPDGLVADDVEIYARFSTPYFPNGYPEACCHRFAPACSPHLAAELAGTSLNVNELAHAVTELATGHDLVLVEGAGGAAVPLGNKQTMQDLMQRLDLPVILVADNKLGVINHALMTIRMLRDSGLDIAGVVMTNTTRPDTQGILMRRNNTETIAHYGNIPILAEIPFIEQIDFDAEYIRHMAPAIRHLTPSPADDSDDLTFDRDHIWHPYTSAVNPLPSVKVRTAHGSRITLEDGTELIDGMASWWCAIHGYAHPALLDAARTQLGRLPHVMFGGLTHDPAIELCRSLCDMTPNGLEHVFLADSGSVSVEAAIKMALQYMQADGQTQRTKIFTIRGGYHGDTCGAMSVCDPNNGMHHLFSGLLPHQIFAPRPTCRFGEPYDPASLAETTRLFEENSHRIAAIIVEPIVQGAGGMYFYHPDYLRGLRELADAHGVLLILDEIATGFGRTGKLFACEWADVIPDIMCVGKALSGGTMTLAATVATSNVAQTISKDGGVFMHGPTFMGNPLACAVATASLEILQQGHWKTQVHAIEQRLETAFGPCRDLPGVKDVRVLGSIGVVEMDTPVNVQRLQAAFIEHGVWLRPFGKLIYVMPPYIITQDEVSRLGSAVFDAIAHHIHE